MEKTVKVGINLYKRYRKLKKLANKEEWYDFWVEVNKITRKAGIYIARPHPGVVILNYIMHGTHEEATEPIHKPVYPELEELTITVYESKVWMYITLRYNRVKKELTIKIE